MFYFLILSFRTQNRNDSINNIDSIVRKEISSVFFEKFGESLYAITGKKQKKHSVNNFKGFFLYPKEKDLLLFLLDLEAICLMKKANTTWNDIYDYFSIAWKYDILTKNHFYIEKLIVLSILEDAKTSFFKSMKDTFKRQCDNEEYDVNLSLVSEYNLTIKMFDWYHCQSTDKLLKKFVELLKEDLLE